MELVLFIAFTWSAGWKWVHWSGFVSIVADHLAALSVTAPAASAARVLLFLESALAAGFFLRTGTWVLGWVSVVLVGFLTAVHLVALFRWPHLPCGCGIEFGQENAALYIARNMLLVFVGTLLGLTGIEVDQ